MIDAFRIKHLRNLRICLANRHRLAPSSERRLLVQLLNQISGRRLICQVTVPIRILARCRNDLFVGKAARTYGPSNPVAPVTRTRFALRRRPQQRCTSDDNCCLSSSTRMASSTGRNSSAHSARAAVFLASKTRRQFGKSTKSLPNHHSEVRQTYIPGTSNRSIHSCTDGRSTAQSCIMF